MTVLWCHSSMYSKRWALWVMYRMFQRDSEKIPLMGLIMVVFLFRTTCWGLTGSLGFRWEGVLHPDVHSKGKKTEGFMLIQKLLLTQEKHWDETCINLYCSQPNCEIHTENNVSSQTACVRKTRSSFASPHTKATFLPPYYFYYIWISINIP